MKGSKYSKWFLSLSERTGDRRVAFLRDWLLTKAAGTYPEKRAAEKRMLLWLWTTKERPAVSGWRRDVVLRIANRPTFDYLGISVDGRMRLSALAKLATGKSNPFFGRKHSRETRDVISYRKRNKPGTKRSPETRGRISKSLRGRVKSDSTKAKIRESWHRSRRYVKCHACGEVVTYAMWKRWHGNSCRRLYW